MSTYLFKFNNQNYLLKNSSKIFKICCTCCFSDIYRLTHDRAIETKRLEYTPDPRGLGHLILTKALENGTAIAQIDGITGEKQSYKALMSNCIRTAIKLQERGLNKTDAILICNHNDLSACVPFISAILLGAVPAFMDPTIAFLEMVYIFKIIKPKFFFCVSDVITMAKKAFIKAKVPCCTIVSFDSCHTTNFKEFLSLSEKEATFKPYTPPSNKQTTAVFFSSKDVRFVRPVALSHFALELQAMKLM